VAAVEKMEESASPNIFSGTATGHTAPYYAAPFRVSHSFCPLVGGTYAQLQSSQLSGQAAKGGSTSAFCAIHSAKTSCSLRINAAMR